MDLDGSRCRYETHTFLARGRPGFEYAYAFIQDLADRLSNRVQLTTDGHKVYIEAVEAAFGADIDYSMLIKLYGEAPSRRSATAGQMHRDQDSMLHGNPDPRHVSTSFVERQNLTMRMQIRRFTRLTNAFSKKVENHVAAVSIHFMHYNFARFIERSGLPRRWRLASRTMFGR